MKIPYSSQRSKETQEVKIKSGDLIRLHYIDGGNDVDVQIRVQNVSAHIMTGTSPKATYIVDRDSSTVEIITTKRQYVTYDGAATSNGTPIIFDLNRVPVYNKQVDAYTQRQLEVGDIFTVYDRKARRDLEFKVTHLTEFGSFVLEYTDKVGYNTLNPVLLVRASDRDLLKKLGVTFR